MVNGEKKLLFTYNGVQVISQFKEWNYGPGENLVYFGGLKMFSYGWNTMGGKRYVIKIEHLTLKNEITFSETETELLEKVGNVAKYLIDKILKQIIITE